MYFLPNERVEAKEFTDATGRRRVKGNRDTEIAGDRLELADELRRQTESRPRPVGVRTTPVDPFVDPLDQA